MMSEDTNNAISLQASGDGPLPSDGRDGRDPSGPEAVPVSRFRAQGQRQGHADERHLWPAFQRLIAECRASSMSLESKLRSKDWEGNGSSAVSR